MRFAASVLLTLGFVALVVAATSAGFNACRAGQPVSVEVHGTEVIRSCGGTNPLPFLIAGLLAVGAAAGLFRASHA